MDGKIDIITEATIKQFVDNFYVNVRNDSKLGPVFDGTIGTSEEAWQPHLERMYYFWSSLMLATGRYHGNPMKKHHDIPSFDIKLFDIWLELFEKTAREIHTDEVVELYMEKSRRVAQSLKLGLYYKP